MKTKAELIEEFLTQLEKDNNLDIDLLYHVDCDEVEDYDDVYNAIADGGGFDAEVIYYHVAIDYLKEHDASLNESMGIAAEMGYSPENINSELLASLLKSQNLRDEFNEVAGEISEFLEELQDRHFCEECGIEHEEEEDAESCCE